MLISFPWKKKPTREKIRKSVRENFGLPVKSSKKVCVKATLPSVKKTEKRPKKAFTGTFDFHGKKKHWFLRIFFLEAKIMIDPSLIIRLYITCKDPSNSFFVLRVFTNKYMCFISWLLILFQKVKNITSWLPLSHITLSPPLCIGIFKLRSFIPCLKKRGNLSTSFVTSPKMGIKKRTEE